MRELARGERMPEVHFVGEIESSTLISSLYMDISTSLTWAIVTGNAAWDLRNGEQAGETQCSLQSVIIILFIYLIYSLQLF